MATTSEDNFFFYEDEVFRVNSKGVVQFGTVIENSELVSSNEETSDDEYDSSDYKMKKGHIRVSWHPTGLTQVLSESKVGLADRSLMPGDVVKMLATDKNTQRGYCNNIKVYATVQIVGTKHVIENIPTSQLSPLAKFTKDLAVYLDHWVGVIRDVHIKLLISCSDGSKAYISDANTLKALLSRQSLGNYKSADDDDVPRMGKPDFYPGQALFAPRFILTSAFTGWQMKSPEFDRLISRHKSLNVKVEAVEVDYVEVAWRCTAYTGNSIDIREPIVKGEELQRLCVLNHFESATNQVGDRGTYIVTSEDVVMSLDSWQEKKKEKLAEESGRKLPVQHARRKGPRRKSKKSKQQSGLPSPPSTPASSIPNEINNQDSNRQQEQGPPLGGESSEAHGTEEAHGIEEAHGTEEPHGIEEDSSHNLTIINNPEDNLNSTIVPDPESNSDELDKKCSSATLVPGVEHGDKCSNGTIVPLQTKNEQDVPIIRLDVASDSEDCWEDFWELSTEEDDEDYYYSGDDSTSCCTTDTGTSVATALTTSESSLLLGQDETGVPTTSESSATVAGTGTELTPRPKRRQVTCCTRLSRLRNVKKKLSQRNGGLANKLKSLPCRGVAEVEDWVGRQCVVEILCTQSTADVVWQDGTTGQNISSMNLYPIHYLDEKEFFPGDFVVRATEDEEDGSPAGEYGVVKQMDHAGRTARVQWFNITLAEGQGPLYLGESEMSVYDLKDHPDFQFRPGSVVMSMGGISPTLDRAESNKATKPVPATQSVMSTCDDGVKNSSLSDDSNPNPVSQLEINGANSLNSCASKSKTTTSSPPNLETCSNTPSSNDNRLMEDSILSNAVEMSTKNISSDTTCLTTTLSSTNISVNSKNGMESSTNSTTNSDPVKSSTNTSENCNKTTDSSTNESKPEEVKEEERVYVGQVLDNFPEGRIKVWWVDGSICSVWPQDLYKIGDYNSDEGELWASSSEGDSWETETETEDEFEDLDGTLPTVEALGLNPDEPLLEELYEQLAQEKPALLAALTSTLVNLTRLDSNDNGTEGRDDPLPLLKEGDEMLTSGCDASVNEFHLKLFRTIYRLSHVLDLLRKDLDMPPLTYSLSIVSTILTGAYKNLTYLDKILDSHQFSSVELEAVLFSLSVIERVNRNLNEEKESKTCSEPESKPSSALNVETDVNPKSNLSSELNAESGVKPESNPSSEQNAESGVKPESNPGSKPESNPGSEQNAETGVKFKVDTGSFELQITRMARDQSCDILNLIQEMFEKHAIEAEKPDSKPEDKTGEPNVEPVSEMNGEEPDFKSETNAECKPSAETGSEITAEKIISEMVQKWPPSFTEDKTDSGLMTDGILGKCVELSLNKVVSKRAELKNYDKKHYLPRMFSSLGARSCAMLCSQLLRAHDELIVKFLSHHNGQLCMLADSADTDQTVLLAVPLYKNKKFQANLKYLKSKLKPEVNDPSSVQPSKVNMEELDNDLVENAVDQSESSGLKNVEINHEEVIIKERDDRLPSTESCLDPALPPPPSSTNDISERTPTSGSDPSPEPFNPSVPSCVPPSDSFVMLDSLATYPHKYAKRASFVGPNSKLFFKALRKEMALLRSSLPPGIWVRGFEDRMDLLSVMIEGPARTPYEDGLFHFDLYLPAEFPQSPPICHYLSYASDRLNPNLYETGKVCVSLLGTWSGRGTEVWTPQSTLLQILISIQGLILNAEPYYNEAGYERQRTTTNGQENSRMYNEMVVLKLVQAMGALVRSPPRVWATETHDHFRARGKGFTERLEYWSKVSVNTMPAENENQKQCSEGHIEQSSEGHIEQSSDGQSGVIEESEKTPGTPVSTGELETSVEKAKKSQKVIENSHGDAEKSHEETKKSLEETEKSLETAKSLEETENSRREEEHAQIDDCDKPNEFELPQFPLLPASRGFCLTLKSLIGSFRTTLKRLELMDKDPVDTNQGSVSQIVVERKDNEAVDKSSSQENSTRKSVDLKDIVDKSVSEKQIGSSDKVLVSENTIVSDINQCPTEQGTDKVSGTSKKSTTTHLNNLENTVNTNSSNQLKYSNTETTNTKNSSQFKSSSNSIKTNELSSGQLKTNLVESAGKVVVARSNSREIVKEVVVIGGGETGTILSRTNSKVDIVSNTINKSKSSTPDQTRLGSRNNSINRSEIVVDSMDTIYGSNVISDSISVHAIKGEGKKKSLDSVNNNNNNNKI